MTQKTIIVVSPHKGEGKTSLVEALAAQKLNWQPMEIAGKSVATTAAISYGASRINVVELSETAIADESLHPVLSKMFVAADAIIEVHFNGSGTYLSSINDILNTKIGSESVEGMIGNKRVLAFTQVDLELPCISWWNSLSEEERNRYNEENKRTGNPAYGTFIEAVLNEVGMSSCYYAMGADFADVFDTSAVDETGIKGMRECLLRILSGR